MIKELMLAGVLITACNTVDAQPWMPSVAGPVKYADVVKGYSMKGEADNSREEKDAKQNGEEREGADHLFEKWCWYWRQHLDKDGYIVPPVRTLNSWLKYAEQNGLNNGAARTTAPNPSNWVFQGPHLSAGGYSGIGRINVVAFDPVDSNTFYVGSPAGSTWKTTDGGHTWASLYDFLPTLGVADIKINPANRNTIYVATGDGDAGDTYSSGVIVSHNGGASWLTTGISWAPTDYNNARSILINPLDTNSMILGTNMGIYKTNDAGATWTHPAPGNFKQILFKPGDTTTVYGSIYTDTSCQIVLSIDGGVTWNPVTSFTDAQRINLAVCPASPTTVMALASNYSSGLEGIYNSTNSGASYTAVYTDDTSCDKELLGWDMVLPTSSCGGQGWYDLCIAMNPTNASEVTIGGVNTYYSSDGGITWTIANGWYDNGTGMSIVHADKHCLAYSPLTGGLFETCDGGVYKNYGPLTSAWTDLSSGLCVTEFYRNAVDDGVSFCIGGCQDDGTKMINGGVSSDLTGGDGMQPLINYGDPADIFYCTSQNGYINMTRDGGASYHGITDTLHSSGGWVSPYLIDPTDTATLLLAYKNVYVTHNNGVYWTAISPVFDTNSNINYLVMAPTNTNYIYAEHDDYNIWKSVLHYTTDYGVTWDTIHVPFTNFISDIAVDPKNEKHLWVTVSGYGTDKVYSYDLATNTWVNESGTLPDLPTDCIVVDKVSLTKYIGTDAAVFYRDTAMANWALFDAHLPHVHVYDLNINYATGEIWAATFGRGMWKSIKADNPPRLGVNQLQQPVLTVSPNPAHAFVTIYTTNWELRNGEVAVKLIAADGKTVLSNSAIFDASGNLRLNTSALSPGFYICEVSNGQVISHAKIVVY